MVGPNRPQIVLFGSSIVQFSYSHEGWGSILTDLYSCKADIVLRGYGGWNTRLALLVLDQIFPKDATIQPSLVIVYFGGNDSMKPDPNGLNAHVPLLEYIQNMKNIVLHIKSLSEKTRIIVLSTPPVNEEKIIKLFGDGIHLTAEASKVVVKEILKVVKEADWEPNLHWKSLPNEFAQCSPTIFVGTDGNTPLNVADLDLDWQAQWI
ncbi:GDSL esterase/lipase CPRD49 isoform X2 [Solanum lycopersicum]|uniref:GDSL esterase/lipase CPRD49 isoform X2 n=1 Tax=Solanum lycopersicum TaxID=4081 RepID=UPI003748A800